MKTLIVLFMLTLACGGNGPWVPSPHPDASNEWSAIVTKKSDCGNWQDPNCHKYLRLEDDSWQVGVFLLYNYGLACPVSSEDITMVRIGESYSCKWRQSR